MNKILSSVFVSSFLDQQKTVKELLEESRDRGHFYLMLAFATFISSLGLINNDPLIILGGMLIAPLLFPILSLSMGVVTSSSLAVFRSFKVISRSMLLVLFISMATAFMFGDNNLHHEILLRIKPDLISFMVALVSGIAVSYAWIRQDLSATLPGIAVSVSLVPPLATVGIGIVMLNRVVVSGSLTLFIISFLATVLGAVLVFSLFGFSSLQKEEEQKIVEEVLEDKVQSDAVEEASQEIIKNSSLADLEALHKRNE